MMPAAWTIFNLPVHALVVHAAVIFVPLAAIALVATGWRSTWRRHYSLPVALLAVAGATAAFIAAQSGGDLQSAIKDAAKASGVRARFGEHPEQGDTAQIAAIAFAITAVAFWAVDRWGRRIGLPTWVPAVMYGAGVLVAAAATLTMVNAGHSGATLVWENLGTYATTR